MWLLYSSWNVKLTAEKEAYTTKSVQITNYIKLKVHWDIFTWSKCMCIIPFWLVDWETAGWPLGDCWLDPGRLLAGPWEGWLVPGKAATVGCTGKLLAGPWEGCWVCWIADFWWFSLLLLGGGSSRLMLIFSCPRVVGAWFFGCPRTWLETAVLMSHKNVRKLAYFGQISRWNQCLSIVQIYIYVYNS